MNKRQLIVIGIVLLVATILFATFTFHQQAQDKSKIQQDDTPVADFNASKPSNPHEKEIRTQRGRKYKKRFTLDKMEDQSVVFENLSSNTAVEPAFPVEQSDIIIIGTITDSQAFISNDKTAVYSEFQITVNRILKNDKNFSVTSESNVVAERIGGKVRFPSGKIQRWGETGHNLPQKNKQYVLFLRWNEEGKDYSILTGYEVKGQIVNPLDGFGGDSNTGIFSNYNSYKNVDLTTFLTKLQIAIANPSAGEKQ